VRQINVKLDTAKQALQFLDSLAANKISKRENDRVGL
jgi:hypothetical protein